MKLFNAFLIIIFISCSVQADFKRESWYQKTWCKAQNGKIEVTLKDRTRVDCLTTTHAIEFDFAIKWAESIGQSLHYARMTGKKPGIVLICKTVGGRRKFRKLKKNLEFYKLDIRVWNINCE